MQAGADADPNRTYEYVLIGNTENTQERKRRRMDVRQLGDLFGVERIPYVHIPVVLQLGY